AKLDLMAMFSCMFPNGQAAGTRHPFLSPSGFNLHKSCKTRGFFFPRNATVYLPLFPWRIARWKLVGFSTIAQQQHFWSFLPILHVLSREKPNVNGKQEVQICMELASPSAPRIAAEPYGALD